MAVVPDAVLTMVGVLVVLVTVSGTLATVRVTVLLAVPAVGVCVVVTPLVVLE